ncbi:MAG: hypothetical protein JWR37_2171 [Mycobacterium sp.]|nr:hypothetical protein [Mycobacterium sp.]
MTRICRTLDHNTGTPSIAPQLTGGSDDTRIEHLHLQRRSPRSTHRWRVEDPTRHPRDPQIGHRVDDSSYPDSRQCCLRDPRHCDESRDVFLGKAIHATSVSRLALPLRARDLGRCRGDVRAACLRKTPHRRARAIGDLRDCFPMLRAIVDRDGFDRALRLVDVLGVVVVAPPTTHRDGPISAARRVHWPVYGTQRRPHACR